MAKKMVSVDGIAVCIKNNIIITVDRYGDLLGYDVYGNLLKKFTVKRALSDNPCYFVADHNHFPSLIQVDDFLKDQQVDISRVPEKLTIELVDKLVFKMAIEKAIDGNRKDILERLRNAEAALSLFPQPAILRNRIREKLNEKKQNRDHSPGKPCIVS